MSRSELNESFCELLASSGAVSGPYRKKSLRITRDEAKALRNALCDADKRNFLNPEEVNRITIKDMCALHKYVGD